jgi:hypothetical protein
MKRSRVGQFALIGSLLLLGASYLRLCWGFRGDAPSRPSMPVTIGMSRVQVEIVCGGPPGDYTTRPYECDGRSGRDLFYEWWITDEGMVGVKFDRNRRVEAVLYRDIRTCPYEIVRWLPPW